MASDTATPASLRASTWSTPVLIGGLSFLLAWKVTVILAGVYRSVVPYSIAIMLFVLFGILSQLFLLFYPLITRRQIPHGAFHFPRFEELLKEFLIAVPVLVGGIVVFSVLEQLIAHFFPGTSFVPREIERLAESQNSFAIYSFILVAVFVAPVTEEVFFRGFLFNAIRTRMPLFLAVIAQSTLFGFMHFFGFTHAAGTSLLGVVLTLIYLWRQTLLAPIIVHACWNCIAMAGILVAMHDHAHSAVLGVSPQESATECVIGSVHPNSPAAEAGLLSGDTITHVDSDPIADFQDLRDALTWYEPGDSVVLTVVRNGMILEITVILTSRRDMSD